MKTKITLVVGLALGLFSAEKIHAEHKSSYSTIYSPSLKAKTAKQDLFGKKKTTYTGHNPFNYFKDSEKKK